MSVADFYRRVDGRARGGAASRSRSTRRRTRWPTPIPFAEDDACTPPTTRPRRTRFWRALVQADRVFRLFRTGFLGKASPVHFFWGSFDLAVTRFSGRAAPPHPGGIPGLPDAVTREAYSHEVSSAGFWPGSDAYPQAAFYSYAYPTPPASPTRGSSPSGARWSEEMGEWLLSVRGRAHRRRSRRHRAALPRIDLSRRRRPGPLGSGARVRDRRRAPAATGRLSARFAPPSRRRQRAQPEAQLRDLDVALGVEVAALPFVGNGRQHRLGARPVPGSG